ncbi:hypothetical protein [Streptomyces sp. NRRL B-24572]|uniref:hypothetical protein n=1 Tax=Streptomyces sp. NRRL B-24572 TaxID=1962156 RepID=UPI000A3C3A5A|nr:hypothetical protein [Streptomyces sp. NRRL B-24572]
MTAGLTWTTGRCWKCEEEDLPVLWLGPAHSADHGHAPLYTCEPCIQRIEALIADHVAKRYAAT